MTIKEMLHNSASHKPGSDPACPLCQANAHNSGPLTIFATRPASLDLIRHGEAYEAALFTDTELRELSAKWRIRVGRVQDAGAHKDVAVLQFIRRSA